MGKADSGGNAQLIYLSHGGGPLPILGDKSHAGMVEFMKHLPGTLREPEKILVISAHWEEPVPTLTGARKPKMVYDYYGFPAEAYAIKYPADGCPELAERIAALLNAQGIKAVVDDERGYDHGMYIPLMMMYPDAGIPTLQLSLLRSLDPEEHISLGKSLNELMSENILIIGSGFSFHNLNAFSWSGEIGPDNANDSFHDWLIGTCCSRMEETERTKRLIGWEKVPGARYCHPREDHLMPLHVCAGIAGRPARLIFDDYILGKRSVAFQWD